MQPGIYLAHSASITVRMYLYVGTVQLKIARLCCCCYLSAAPPLLYYEWVVDLPYIPVPSSPARISSYLLFLLYTVPVLYFLPTYNFLPPNLQHALSCLSASSWKMYKLTVCFLLKNVNCLSASSSKKYIVCLLPPLKCKLSVCFLL